MNHEATVESLTKVFEDWTKALNADIDKFWTYFDADSETLDEDFPWRMTKQEIIDHIDFHAKGAGKGLWEFFQWIPRDVNVKVFGTTGHVSGFSTFRGKPRDAGFRQRFMGFTLTWYLSADGWRLVCWHQSVLLGRIVGASPS